jgi:glycosyltransferase involved in cell wall biosynthesis
VRVCFLTHYYPPEVGAPQTRIDLLARTLSEQGLDVVVHTGFPHYPSGGITAGYRNRPWQQERRGGVRIVRSAVYPAANRGFARRLADHAAFAAFALSTARLTGALDVVVAETPPLFTAAAGVAYAALKRAALVVNVADRWPASAVELGALRSAQAVQAAEALERWIYSRADLITAPTAGIAEALDRLPHSAGKVRRTWPVVDFDRFPRFAEAGGPVNGPLRLLYAGTIGLAQGVDVLVEASMLAGPGQVETTIAGDGAEAAQIRQLIDAGPVPNVRLLGGVAADRVPDLYAQADACAVLLRDRPIFAGAIPTKLVEAMAAGRPVLLSALGESAELVARAGAGIVVSPEDPQALATAIRALQADPARRRRLGAAGRRFVEDNLGARRAAREWSEVLADAAASQASKAPGFSSR